MSYLEPEILQMVWNPKSHNMCKSQKNTTSHLKRDETHRHWLAERSVSVFRLRRHSSAAEFSCQLCASYGQNRCCFNSAQTFKPHKVDSAQSFKPHKLDTAGSRYGHIQELSEIRLFDHSLFFPFFAAETISKVAVAIMTREI